MRGRDSSDWLRPSGTHLGGILALDLSFLEMGAVDLAVDSGGVAGGVGLDLFMIERELDLGECIKTGATNERFSRLHCQRPEAPPGV